nr:MAG TPA: hypothetical protein [Caudoviricetes sp.]
MAAPYDYVKVDGAGRSFTIPVDVTGKKAPSPTAHTVLLEASGILTPGENDAKPVERTFSSGTVLPPRPRFTGRDITLTIAITVWPWSQEDLKGTYNHILATLTSGSLTVSTNYPTSHTCQLQRIEILDNWGRRGPVRVKVYLKSAS